MAMNKNSNNIAKAKPFIKWVGGKGQLIEQLDSFLPSDFDKWDDVTYIEPFVGGGAMLFYMLQRYPNIKHAVINDVNQDLTNLYWIVRYFPEALIKSLSYIENKYLAFKSDEERRAFFLKCRDSYNEKKNDFIENAALFIFLNKTCFNGLYRVNKKGLFNVPFGKYKNPKICDSATIRNDSKLLQKVEILNGDFEKTFGFAKGNTFFYFDPPYRPLTKTSVFTGYTKDSFNDDSQVRLKEYCDKINKAGYKFMLSNSDCQDKFFDTLYADYEIDRVFASRSINCNGQKRGKLTEILVHN
jgi:DNA adenine methylase